MFATLQVNGASPTASTAVIPVIANQPIQTTVTIYNSGAVPVNVNAIQGYILPVTAGGTPDNEVIVPGQVQVPAAVAGVPGSQIYDLTFLIFAPQIPGLLTGNSYTLACTCYTSDGSVFSAQLQVATTPSVYVPVGGQGGPSTYSQQATTYGNQSQGWGRLSYDLNFAPFLAGVFA
jgi:hypothetical protein